MTSVMWFRRDLRLTDNMALANACLQSEKLIFVFQVNPEQFEVESFSQQSFFSSVKHFRDRVNKIGHLQILYGDVIDSFQRLKEAVPDWDNVYFNCCETGVEFLRDEEAINFFTSQKIVVHCYDDHYLHGATEIKNQAKEFYKVFTPYYRKWEQLIKLDPIKVKLREEKIVRKILFQQDEAIISNLFARLPELPFYIPGEKAGKKRLKTFIDTNLPFYHYERSIPSADSTSKISAYLRTGEISIRTVWYELKQAEHTEGKTFFSKQLCWRDFYNMLYYANPEQRTKPLQTNFSYIDWENDEQKFANWKAGKTGYPLVDAGMRQLNKTGWMHNRLRMITASFLTKDLHIDWRLGEKYFAQMLVDYDAASNIGGWQWAASTGCDAVPYFRVFNPSAQAKKIDPLGSYIREYVDELVKVPTKYIYEPWKMKEWQQKEFAVDLGNTYPYPIVDHNEARKKAISLYESSRELAKFL